MAAASRKFIGSLYRYGKESEENKKELQTWKKAALRSIADGNGGQLSSMSGNGLSATMSITSMTNTDWFAALDLALQWIDAGIPPQSTTLARIV